MIAGKIPPARIPSRGIENKNSQDSAPHPLAMTRATMAATGMTTSRVANSKTPKPIFWPRSSRLISSGPG